MDPEIVDLTQGDDFNDLANEVESMAAEQSGPSTSGRTRNQRRYRPPQGPKGPPPYPTYEREILSPPGNFWWNRKHHRCGDVPPIEEANPLKGLKIYLPEMASFIASQDGLLQNLNLVAERIYNLGANRPCADEFCQYGRAARPVIPEPKEIRIQDVSVSVQDAVTATPRYRDLLNAEVQFCLPTLVKGRKLAPTKRTLWSSGMDPKTLALAHASFGGIPGRDAIKAAKSTDRAFKKAKVRTDPKLQSEVRVALDQILARKKTVDASTNTRRKRTATQGTTMDEAQQESKGTQCNFPQPRPLTADAETSTTSRNVPANSDVFNTTARIKGNQVAQALHRRNVPRATLGPLCHNCRTYGHQWQFCRVKPLRLFCHKCGKCGILTEHCRCEEERAEKRRLKRIRKWARKNERQDGHFDQL